MPSAVLLQPFSLQRAVIQHRLSEVKFTPGLTPLIFSGFTLVTRMAHLLLLHSSAIYPSSHHTAWLYKAS